MPDLDTRLTRCFQAVFPARNPDAIPAMCVDNTAEWDSVASVTLLRVVEEEFDTTIDLFDLDELKSFEDLRRYLTRSDA